MTVQVPGEGFTAGVAGRLRWWQEGGQGMTLQVPEEGFTAGVAGRLRWWQEGRQEMTVQVPGEGFTAGIAGRSRWWQEGRQEGHHSPVTSYLDRQEALMAREELKVLRERELPLKYFHQTATRFCSGHSFNSSHSSPIHDRFHRFTGCTTAIPITISHHLITPTYSIPSRDFFLDEELSLREKSKRLNRLNIYS
jgi:hypothetical protein